jgi:hypothetical protein
LHAQGLEAHAGQTGQIGHELAIGGGLKERLHFG